MYFEGMTSFVGKGLAYMWERMAKNCNEQPQNVLVEYKFPPILTICQLIPIIDWLVWLQLINQF